MNVFYIYILVLSFITFIIYGADKARAQRGLWRIAERTLLTLSLLGGALGGLAAMYLFRHKTKHWYFYAVNILAFCLHLCAGALLYHVLGLMGVEI